MRNNPEEAPLVNVTIEDNSSGSIVWGKIASGATDTT